MAWFLKYHLQSASAGDHWQICTCMRVSVANTGTITIYTVYKIDVVVFGGFGWSAWILRG